LRFGDSSIPHYIYYVMIERVKEMRNEIQLTSVVGTMLKVIDGDRTHRLKVLSETPTGRYRINKTIMGISPETGLPIEIDYARTINHRTMIKEQIQLQRCGGVAVIEKI